MATALESVSPTNILARMTLEQKAGQVMLIGFDGPQLSPELGDIIRDLHVGGVIFYDRNIESPGQVAELNAALQDTVRRQGDAALFVTVDQEGGTVARLKESKGFTEFPSQMAVAATGDMENARQVARALSGEMRAVGFNMDLAPDLDVNNNPANPVIGVRSYSSDPKRVAQFGVAFIEAMQGAGIAAIAKHFPGHGDTTIDSHVSLATVPHDRARLDSIELVPFRAAMQAGVAGIMSAHLTFPAIDSTPGLAATLSQPVLTDLVRGELKYDGLVMTDELTMGALATSGYPAPRAAVMALAAGADILLFQTGYAMHRQVHRALVQGVQSGEIPLARLDQAVWRILAAKQRLGILEQNVATCDPANLPVGTPEAKRLARAVAAQSITLVRNDAHILPLDPSAKLCLVEMGVSGLGARLGTANVQVGLRPTPEEIASVRQVTKDADAVIATTTDVAKNPEQADLVDTIVRDGRAVIVVALRSPYDLLYLKNISTYLATYGAPPPVLDALAELLRGRALPQGRLPVELPGIP